eukprot:CAMPEP_0174854826 /NCGR_PEP_ID=MMETSP1114-20130205/31973_1 /TAXON_ID=312471 /ORGANISM="Neobodo designis, Strain CCAP 1951/1" /LENGTH=179 /DNA_ID=CAMNT_0016089537 /DNA_START=33 /DNA_END=569 /DNA_ORIENTATION=-
MPPVTAFVARDRASAKAVHVDRAAVRSAMFAEAKRRRGANRSAALAAARHRTDESGQPLPMMDDWAGPCASTCGARELHGIGLACGEALGLDMNDPAVVDALLQEEAMYLAEVTGRSTSESVDSDDDCPQPAPEPLHPAQHADADADDDEAYALYEWHCRQQLYDQGAPAAHPAAGGFA